MLEGNPGMPRLLPNRICRSGEGGIGKRSERNGDVVRPGIGARVHARTASRAEINADFAALLAVADVFLACSFRADLVLQEIYAYSERRTGAPLTFLAMTGGDNRWLARGFDAQRAAAAAGNSVHLDALPRPRARSSYSHSGRGARLSWAAACRPSAQFANRVRSRGLQCTGTTRAEPASRHTVGLPVRGAAHAAEPGDACCQRPADHDVARRAAASAAGAADRDADGARA